MRLFLVFQVLDISFYRERTWVIPSHPTDGVTAFHMLFLALFHSENVIVYDRLS